MDRFRHNHQRTLLIPVLADDVQTRRAGFGIEALGDLRCQQDRANLLIHHIDMPAVVPLDQRSNQLVRMLLGQFDHLGIDVLGVNIGPAQRCAQVFLVDPNARYAKVMLAGHQPQSFGQGNVGHKVMHVLNASDLGFGQMH